jgi:MFS family permease
LSAAALPSRTASTGTLFLARTVYAFNWYNIGAVLSLVRSSFGVGGIQVGIVLGAFLLGAAVFQLPAGFAAMRWGARAVSIVALGAMGVFSVATAASPNWVVLAVLRFGVGAGAAFFFSPALALVASYYPSGERGPVIGLFNAGFSIGSAAGLFLGALAGVAFGWPAALLAGGVALLGVAGVAVKLLPPTPVPAGSVQSPAALWAAGRPVLRSRPVWALALAIAGLWAAFYAAAQYFVEFASEAHPGWGLTIAAAMPTVMIAAEVVGGPVGGWFGERYARMRRILLLWGLASGVGIALIPWLTLYTAWPMFAFLGFADGVVFAVLYLLPSYLPELEGPSFALGLALLNSIQIFLGSGLAVTFAVIAAWAGYSVAWAVTGAVAIAFLPLLIAVPEVRPSRRRDPPLSTLSGQRS